LKIILYHTNVYKTIHTIHTNHFNVSKQVLHNILYQEKSNILLLNFV